MREVWAEHKKLVIGGAVVGLLMLVGLVNLVQETVELVTHGKKPGQQPAKLTVVNDAKKSSFDFLVPGEGKDWEFDPKSPVFDASKGVVNYKLSIHDGISKLNATVSQQEMPEELKSENSPALNRLLSQSNVVVSVPVGDGKLYFEKAIVQGGSSSGVANTVIYASKDILMFGQAGGLVSYATWQELMGSMKKQPAL